MNGIFWNCYNLSKLDLSSFNTNNIIDMSRMFYNCNNLNIVSINKLNIKSIQEAFNITKLIF